LYPSELPYDGNVAAAAAARRQGQTAEELDASG
jgi:hypothetical protein